MLGFQLTPNRIAKSKPRPAKGRSMRLGVIDLGTNSVRFDAYEFGKGASFVRIHREKQMIRLGDGLFEGKKLDASAVERTLTAFTSFRKLMDQLKVEEVVAFATSALRDAQNRKWFIKKIEQGTGISIEVISGEEEARLIAKGILANDLVPQEVFALIDIGGGSTEVSVSHKRTLLDVHSFDLGANRLKQLVNLQQPVSERGDKELRQMIRKLVKSTFDTKNWPSVNSVIGSSGTIRCVRKILKKAGLPVDPFALDALKELNSNLKTLNTEALLQVPGMEEKRVDIIYGGSVLLEELVTAFGANEVLVSEYSLRDGILESQLEARALE